MLKSVPQTPQIGLYQVIKVYNEPHNGKLMPIAEVIFKAPNWSKFDFGTRRLRLRSLYNPSSIGPKAEYGGDNLKDLYLHMIHIINMTEKPDANNPTRMLWTIEWDVFKPSNYHDLIQEDKEIEADIYLQEEADHLYKELLMNELLVDEQNDNAAINDFINSLPDDIQLEGEDLTDNDIEE